MPMITSAIYEGLEKGFGLLSLKVMHHIAIFEGENENLQGYKNSFYWLKLCGWRLSMMERTSSLSRYRNLSSDANFQKYGYDRRNSWLIAVNKPIT